MFFNKKSETKPLRIIHYESESVDITKNCCQYLLENNYFQNSKEDNFKLLEKAMINYSISKFGDLSINVSKIEINDWENLSEILEKLDYFIPTEEGKKGFFGQYNQCMIYVHSCIQKEKPIQVTSGETTMVNDSNHPTTIVLDQSLPDYVQTLSLFNILKETYAKEKNPVLHK